MKDIIEISLKRTSKGLKVRVCSEFFEEYYKENSTIGVVNYNKSPFHGMSFYSKINPFTTQDMSMGFSLYNGTDVSLFFLQLVGLSNGVEFIDNLSIMNTNRLQEFTKMLDNRVRNVYTDIVCESEVSLVLLTGDIEEDNYVQPVAQEPMYNINTWEAVAMDTLNDPFTGRIRTVGPTTNNF